MSVSSITTFLSGSSHFPKILIKRSQCRLKCFSYSTHSDKPPPQHEATRHHVRERTRGTRDQNVLHADGRTGDSASRVAPINYLQQCQKTESYLHANYSGFSEECQRLQKSIVSGKIDAVECLRTILPAEPSPASINIIRACLSAERKRITSSQRWKRKSMLKPGFAAVIMQHLFEADPILWQSLMVNDSFSFDWLCYCALAEGLEHILLGWMGVEDATEAEYSDAERRTLHLARNSILRSLIAAHDMNDVDSRADEAILCLFKVNEMSASAKRGPGRQLELPLHMLSLWPATSYLCSALGSGTKSKTDPVLFDRFLEFYQRYSSLKRGEDARLGRSYGIASLHLSHPTRPDHIPALTLLREIASEMSLRQAIKEEVDTWLPARYELQKKFCDRASALARSKGQMQDSELIDALERRLFKGQ